MNIINVKLEDISTIVSGSTAPKDERFNEFDGLPFIRAGHLEELCNGQSLNKLMKISEDNAKGLVRVPKDTVIFAKSGMSCLKNRIYLTDQDAYIVNHLVGIVCNSKIVMPKYLKYYLLYYNPSRIALDESYPSIRINDIKKIEVSVPNIKNQNYIVNILDKAHYLIDKRKQQIEVCDELIKSQFVEVFGDPASNPKGWEKHKLKEVCKINPNKPDNKLVEGLEVSFIPMTSVSDKGELDTSIIKIYDEVKTGFTYFAENDVLFAKITPCMENGKGAVAVGLKNGIGFGSTEFHVIRPIEGVSNPYWIYYLTMFDSFRKEAERKMTGSAGQRRVPAVFLENYEVGVPPYTLQKKFATFVQKVYKLKSSLKQSLSELENNFNALMQKAFNGELFE